MGVDGLRDSLFSKRSKSLLFISSDSRRKGTKEDCYPKAPSKGMQTDYAGRPATSGFGYGSRAFALRVRHVFLWLAQPILIPC